VASAPDTLLSDYYRYPAGTVDIRSAGEMRKPGFFRFGSARCFGSCALIDSKDTLKTSDKPLPDALQESSVRSGSVHLPFDLNEVVTNLRRERYVPALRGRRKKLLDAGWIRQAYYLGRRFMPVAVRKHFQRAHLADWDKIPFPAWPVDCSVDLIFEKAMGMALQARGGEPIPFVWFWPDGHDSCVIMTHDIEQADGRDLCPMLMDMAETVGMRSSFQVIPEERYQVPPSFLDEVRRRGHEVNIHDLNHDGRLYREREEFLRRAAKIAEYARQFGAEGFRSAILYRNLEWYEALEFGYDMSVPNVAHLDGLISFNIHPDYVAEKRASDVYGSLLVRLASLRDELNVWSALPREVNRWWRQRSQMEVVRSGNTWEILGDGSDRAVLARASLDNGSVVYDRGRDRLQ
jgi:hypothetical protein